MKNSFENVKKRYQELKAEREKYVPRWEEISRYVGIRVQPQAYPAAGESNKSRDLDKYTEDPTAALSVQQASDYLKGIMWGNGDGAISIEPTDDILEFASKEELDPWYKFATKQILTQMNHPNAGLNSALDAYFYDQNAFGTSGIGGWPNSAYGRGYDTNVMLYRPYGVDSLCLDEGKNGLPQWVCNMHNWRVSRLVSEFCDKEKGFDEEMFKKLPEKVQAAWNNNNMNQTFNIVLAIVPRDDFMPGALGKKGCKYVGYWFEESENKAFWEEDYEDLPIAVARAVKIRGEVYGRSAGTMLISTIRCINQAVSDCMVSMAKMLNPPIGILNTALFGDDVVDTSENGLTVLNAAMLAGQQPIFPIQDVGDPSKIVNWLVPYLNEKVAAAFKIDVLLDFSANSDMTATESLQRFSIRGRSISGMILQQKTELFEPLIRRTVSVCMKKGVLGVDPTDEKRVAELIDRGIRERIVPAAVVECIKSGKPWYKVKFNNEVDKLGKTEKVDNLLKLINVITALMAVYPQISIAVNWYSLLEDVSDALGLKQNIISEKEFRKQIEAQAHQQAALLQVQAAESSAAANRNNAAAIKDMENGQGK